LCGKAPFDGGKVPNPGVVVKKRHGEDNPSLETLFRLLTCLKSRAKYLKLHCALGCDLRHKHGMEALYRQAIARRNELDNCR
jgi:hypothetical protein